MRALPDRKSQVVYSEPSPLKASVLLSRWKKFPLKLFNSFGLKLKSPPNICMLLEVTSGPVKIAARLMARSSTGLAPFPVRSESPF